MGKTPGRRAYTVGVDMGATKILAALVDDQGHILMRKKRATGSEEGAAATIERMTDGILSAVGEGGVPLERVDAVGIGAPGPLDPETGVVISAPNLKWEPNVPLKRLVQEKVGRPVFVDNDVNLGTLGEATRGAGKGLSDLIGIFVGTGIGGGIILNGELYEGTNKTAGEVGHLILQAGGPLCGCGNRGCMEALASRTAMERDIRQAVADGQSSVISELADLRSDAPIKSSVLAKAYRQGDAVVVGVVNRACEYLGIGIGSLVNLLSPQMVVLGGGVIEALGAELIPRIRETAQAHAFPQAMQDVQIVGAELGDDAGVLGAAELARRKTAPSEQAPEAVQEAPAVLDPDPPRRIEETGFGYIIINGERYERDVVIGPDGTVKKRKKKLSRKKHGTAHTVSAKELKAVLKGRELDLLVVGTGHSGGLSLGDDAIKWLDDAGVACRTLLTPDAVEVYEQATGKKAAFLHVTC